MGRSKKKCFLSKVAGDQCTSDLTPRSELSVNDIRHLKIRSGCLKSLQHVCSYHNKYYLSLYASNQRECCNPFGIHHRETQAVQPLNDGEPPRKKRKKSASRSLSVITLDMRDNAKSINLNLIPGKKICVSCKITLASKLNQNSGAAGSSVQTGAPQPSPASVPSTRSIQEPSFEDERPTEDQKNDESFVESLQGLNSWLSALGYSPINGKKLEKQKNYSDKVMQKLRSALATYTKKELLEDQRAQYFDEMVAQLKDFIENNKDKKKKVLALTAAPKSWSISKLEETFGVTNFLARLSKDVVKEKGILSTPSPKVGRRLSLETEKLVIGFYLNDNNSRPLPGKKDVISVKENGIRVKKTKRLVLSTLSTLHGFYLAEHPNNPISVGKFCELRPKQCVLAGAAGTHIICVCTYHENPLLMFEAADLEEAGFPNVRSCREMLLCAEPTVECFLKKCQRCPDSTQLQEQLEVYFDSKEIDSVTYNQWESTDRANLLHLTKTTEEFIDDFISQVDGLITHDFISKQQAAYYKETVQNLKEGEIVVNVDFAENFSHIKQRSSQSNYFNVKQSTLHPFYMQYINGKGEIDKHCFVIISNHMDHSTVAVNIFQKKFIDYIRTTLNIEVKKIIYFSDGCAAQYKNKKAIANLWFHEKDFQVPAEWHFYATSHGKTACDGIGGMVKHKVYRHCLGLTAKDPQIETAFDFYSWVKTNIEGVISIYVDSSEVTAYESTRRVRWQTALDIDGMQSHHAFIPVKPNPVVMMKLYSYSNVFELRDISTKEFQLELSEVKGFITFRENNAKWKLGLVTEHNEDTEDFEVQVLESIGKASNYQYEYTDNHSTVSLQDVLTLVNPTLQKKGKIIKILARDAKSANVKLANS